jgi:filamentous hemagglutinin family protein
MKNHAVANRLRPAALVAPMRCALGLALAACCLSLPLRAHPTHPTLVQGTASFQQAGNTLSITTSHNAIINWGSFSIGVNELTRFIQPSALSAVLNRVTGTDPSTILGTLQSNGRVFLINPSGIVFGAGARIDVAGLVASTLGLSDADFLAGRLKFSAGSSSGSITQQGEILAGGGPVYLVGSAVTQQGLIRNPGGEIVLAAGSSVELVDPGTPSLRVEISAGEHAVRNLGSLIAEAGRIGIHAGLITQGGVINADSVVTEGGRILLRASRNALLEPGSVISARGQGGGRIEVLAGDTAQVAGTLDASAPARGSGGFIETSGRLRVHVDGKTRVSTAAPGGVTGTWLVDPHDLLIAASGGDMTGTSIAANLATTSVVLSSDQGGNSGSGDILVNDAIAWNSPNSLTLTAQRNIRVNSAITNAGSGGISLHAGWDGSSAPSSPMLSHPALIAVNAPITTAGPITLEAMTDVLVTNANLASGSALQPGSTGHVLIRALDGNITMAGSTVSARGRDAPASAAGAAGIEIRAEAGSIAMHNSSVTARGGTTGTGVQGGAASVSIMAGGAETGSESSAITGSQSRLDAIAQDGGPAILGVSISSYQANEVAGNIDFSGSILSASSGGSATLLISAPGTVSLGQLNSSGLATVYAGGGIRAGSAGPHVLAPQVFLSAGSGGIGAGDPVQTRAGTLQLMAGGAIEVRDGGSPILTAIEAAGDATLKAAGHLDVALLGDGVNAGGSLRLAADGNVTITGGYLGSPVQGAGGTTVQAGGNLSVLRGLQAAVLGSEYSDTTIVSGGNVVVDRSVIRGGPEVRMTVGGTVSVNGLSAEPGSIQAHAPDTIRLAFTTPGGTYASNGVNGRVFDPSTGTGFRICVSGICTPALAGTNLIVSQPGASDPVTAAALLTPANTLVVATDQANVQLGPRSAANAGNADEKRSDRNPEVPVCR